MRGSLGIKWHDLGIELLDYNDIEELDAIKAKHPSDLDKCCTKMFVLWQMRQPKEASWNQLIKALSQPSVNLHSLANKIEQMLLQSKPQG